MPPYGRRKTVHSNVELHYLSCDLHEAWSEAWSLRTHVTKQTSDYVRHVVRQRHRENTDSANIMERVLLASTVFAVIMELMVVPRINILLLDSRWSLWAFVGAVMFLFACSNFLYCIDWRWLTYAVIESFAIDIVYAA